MNFVFRRKGEQYPWLATEWSRHSVWPEHETVIISFHKKMKRRALLYIYIYIVVVGKVRARLLYINCVFYRKAWSERG